MSDHHCCAKVMGQVTHQDYEEFTRCVDIQTVDTMGNEKSDDMWMEMYCHPMATSAMHMLTSSMTVLAALIFLSIY